MHGYRGPLAPEQVRRRILATQARVDLFGLVRFCWDQGIIVLHLAETPEGGKKLDGLAMFCGERPVVVLASGRKGPPWLAFHLAHELGHLFRDHVRPGDPPLVDGDIAQVDDDQQEREADEFACQVLTGSSTLPLKTDDDIDADDLAERSKRYGEDRGIDPGTVILCYARSNDRWAVAQLALKHLGLNEGAHRIIAAEVHRHLKDVDIPEATERFLEILSQPV